MKNFTNQHLCVDVGKVWMVAIALLINGLFTYGQAQCTAQTQKIQGKVFLDQDNDGTFTNEAGVANVTITAYADGHEVTSTRTSSDGNYTLDNLTDGKEYKIVFRNVDNSLEDGNLGPDNNSSIRFLKAPACNVHFGLKERADGCNLSTQIAFTCFVQGEVTENADMPTIVGTNYGFNSGSNVNMYANHGETGSVWGMAWKNHTKELFSSAFVKQFAGLKDTPYSIYKTDTEKGGTTKYIDVADLGADTAPLITSDIMDCAYGRQVGRYGLGGMTLSSDERILYVAVLNSNQIVAIDTENPVASTTTIYDVPQPNGLADGKEYRAFALTQHEDNIYVGVTITAAEDKKEGASIAVVMKLDPTTGSFEEMFRTNYIKGYWQDEFTAPSFSTHWLTDLAFTDAGNIILSLSDRAGHRYCKEQGESRLDVQNPDILMIGYNATSDKWELESNGSILGLSGSGVGNGEGPDGGEFFGNDHFPANPKYHSEVALGSVMVMPGTQSVIATVYDPLQNTYSGGIHRYSTVDGSLLGAKEFYTNNFDISFGKASGFGDLVSLCGKEKVQVGNYVWIDENGDGVQDAQEPTVQDAQVNLYNNHCELVSTTYTDENGQYVFMDEVLSDTDFYITVGSNLYDANTGLYSYQGNANLTWTKPSVGSDDQDSNTSINVSCLQESALLVNTSENNFSYDIGLVESSDFDLALTKELIGSPFVSKGQNVTFEIKVYNQGAITAKNVMITDYIPNGYVYLLDDNLGWTYDGDAATFTITEEILPGKTSSIYINLKISETETDYAQFINIAEITSAEDKDGNPREDIDSTADDNPENDNGGNVADETDDNIDDNGTIDEDDHDPSTVKIFDLALKIELDEDKIYYNGDKVHTTITVYNQGQVDAKTFTISNYVPGGLFFLVEDNPDWNYNSGRLEYTDNEVLEAGTSRTYPVTFLVGKLYDGDNLVNYAEISKSIPVGGDESVDFDSTPDALKDNDLGGTPETDVDNVVLADSDIDEDDHDPVLIRTKYFDLALIKTTEDKLVDPGSTVSFTITVTNQGSAEVDQVTIIDYIPEGLRVNDSNWASTDNKTYTRTIELVEPLRKGDSFETSIVMETEDDLSAQMLVNYAEILHYGLGGNDMSDKDIDSHADNINDNDAGGDVNSDNDNNIELLPTLDEDDHDPAALIISDTDFVSECLNNATDTEKGQFEDTFTITSVSGSTWFIESVQNYYEGTNLITNTGASGLTMTETSIGNGMSDYTFTAFKYDGDVTYISFRNEADDIETFTPPVGRYTDLIISGDRGVSSSDTESEYSIDNPSNGQTYTWTVSGGTIVGNDTGTSITVDWSAVADDSVYDINVEADGCTNPAAIEVTTSSYNGAMHCLANVNLSLDNNCEKEVTPEDVYSGSEDASEFVIMLFDSNGEVIPNATLTTEHIGQVIEAKVLTANESNACWGYITVEDKIKPSILCNQEIELQCHKYEEYEGPFASDNCSNPTVQLQTDGVEEHLYCDDNYTMRITKRYVAIDEYGNQSEPCEVTINLLRVDLDAIEFPEDRTMFSGNPVDCIGYATNEEGLPAISETGSPIYMDEALLPDFVGTQCNLSVAYIDNVVSNLGGVKKIERTFYVMESHCDPTSMRQYVQKIDIVDTTPPVITECPDDITVSADVLNCSATLELPLPVATDECSDNLTYTISSISGFIDDGEDRTVTLGYKETPYEFTYRVTDEAGLSDECTIYVTVEDKTPPIAICDSDPVITLGGNSGNDEGEAFLTALALDDGSYDYCMLDRLEIARMDANDDCDINGQVFGERIRVCCSDVGEDVMVILRAYDIAGNYNECMVSLTVQDKTPPTLTAPNDVTIECGEEYEPLSQFGEATFFDVCGADLTENSTVNLNTCGVGTITRVFTVTDGVNTVTDEQIITVINSNPFDRNSIVWPENYESVGECNADLLTPDLLPEANGYPTWTSDGCDDVGASYSDQIFTYDPNDLNNRDNCYKILRTWRVMDWCQMNIPGYTGETHQQIIKVNNNVAPNISHTPIGDVVTSDCNAASISFSAIAEDDCTPDDGLSWILRIDLDRDGYTADDYDYVINGYGNEINHVRDIQLGEHMVSYTFYDACNNPVTVQDFFTVATDKAPTASCKDAVIGLQPMDLDGDGVIDNEMAMICVVDVVDKPFHECDIDFIISFDADELVEKIPVDCDDLGLNEITVYYIDIFGNISECDATVEVQDNNDVDICTNIQDCIVCPAPLNESADSDCAYTVDSDDYDVSLTDLGIDGECGELTITHDYTVGVSSQSSLDGAVFPLGATIVTWSIVDDRGRMFECIQNILITDNEMPSIDCGNDISISSTADGTDDCAYTNGTIPDAVATDNCDLVSLVHNYGTGDNTTLSGVEFPLGETVITWTATDATGLESTCEVTINVIDDTDPNLSCPELATINLSTNPSDDCNYLHNGTELDPVVDDECSTVVTLSNSINGTSTLDGIVFELGTTVITWTAVDEDDNTVTCDQTIVIVDDIDPELTCESSININDSDDSSIDCGVTVSNIDPTVVDNCDNTVTVSYSYTNEDGEEVNGTSLDGVFFPIGETTVTWTAIDQEGNTSTCVSEIVVEDNEIVDCIEQGPFDVVIPFEGTVTINESILTSEYVDACGEISYEFENNVFDCDDVGTTQTVTYTIRDENDNETTCSFDVNITIPEPECSAMDVTLNLDEDGSLTITPDMVVDVNLISPCGEDPSIVLSESDFNCNDRGENTITITVSFGIVSQTCEATVTIVDELYTPQIDCSDDLSFTCAEFHDTYGGDVTALLDANPHNYTVVSCQELPDNPFDVQRDMVVGLNDCGYGIITRIITVTDTETGISDECSQVISIENDNILTQDYVDDLLTTTVYVNECLDQASIDPNESLGIITQDDFASFYPCTDITIEYVDEQEEENSCEAVITRTWTITDQCQLSGDDPSAGIFTTVQTIYVMDNQNPQLIVAAETAFDAGADCEDEYNYAGLVSAIDCNEVTFEIVNPLDNTDVDGVGPLNVGNNTIIYRGTDACGNTSEIEVEVFVRPTSETFICPKAYVDLVQNPVDGSLDTTINISDQIQWQIDSSCVNFTDLEFSYDRNDVNDDNRYFDCDDVAEEELVLFVYTFVDGVVTDSCKTLISISDPNNLCPDNGLVEGAIYNVYSQPIGGYTIELDGSEKADQISSDEGDYAFANVTQGYDYTVNAYRDDYHANGVTVIDMILLQRHLLGMGIIDNPYQMLAADVNNDESISMLDLIELRSVILRLQSEFSNNTSWRGISDEIDLDNTTTPWDVIIEDGYSIENLTGRRTVNFVGFKVGDLNNSADRTSPEIRGEVLISAQNQLVRSKEEFALDFKPLSSTSAYGFQIGIKAEGLHLTEVKSEAFVDGMISLNQVSDDEYIVMITNPRQINIDEEDVLFTLIGTSDREEYVANLISLNDRITDNEWVQSLDGGTARMALRWDEAQSIRSFIVSQNTPNPWVNNTSIDVSLPVADEVSIIVRDFSGRTVYSNSVILNQGNHTITIDDEMVKHTGIYHVELKAGNKLQRIKMIKIK